MNMIRQQYRIYLKMVKFLVLLLLFIFLFNIALSSGINRLTHQDQTVEINTVFIQMMNFVLILLVITPAMTFSMLPYFFSFGVTRRRHFINVLKINGVMAVFSSLVIVFLYFGQNILYGEKLQPLYYMGISSANPSWSTILMAVLLYFGICILVSSLCLLITAVFLRMGVLYGLSAILLVLSIPLFFLRSIVDFIVWGGYGGFIGAGLILLAIMVNALGWIFTAKIEIKG